ncbi:MFS transporter small subunit [Saccharopolyspora karakumensis]
MTTANRQVLLVIAWLWVGVPFLYGLYELITKVTKLFTG